MISDKAERVINVINKVMQYIPFSYSDSQVNLYCDMHLRGTVRFTVI